MLHWRVVRSGVSRCEFRSYTITLSKSLNRWHVLIDCNTEIVHSKVYSKSFDRMKAICKRELKKCMIEKIKDLSQHINNLTKTYQELE